MKSKKKSEDVTLKDVVKDYVLEPDIKAISTALKYISKSKKRYPFGSKMDDNQ